MTGAAGLSDASLAPALARLEGGAGYKESLEELLLELAPADASRLDLFLRESRGAWLLFTRGAGGRALLVGDALSGTALALARLGWGVTLCDRSEARLAYAAHRQRDLCGDAPRTVRAEGARLPFADGAFDLVVREGPFVAAGGDDSRGPGADELARVARGEVGVVAENRLGYKLSTGHRGSFRVPGLLEFARRALRPAPGARTLPGHERALAAAGLASCEAFALYPTSRDFALVVAARRGAAPDAAPALPIGPKERANRPKVWAHRAGLFPWLTSSFALVARRSAEPRATRAQRVLDALAERLGEPAPRVEHAIATRGNSVVLLTALPGRPEAEPAGRWVVHLPISPRQELRVRRAHARLRELRARFPAFPCPEPLAEARVEGAYVTCERRLGGLAGPQVSGDPARMPRLLADLARALATLRVEPARPWDDAATEELLAPKFDRVAAHAHPAAARREVERLRGEARERLQGLAVPRVVCHADLRSKHVQADPATGALVGVLDWGSSEAADLPYFDLVNWIVHERQHVDGIGGREAWDLVRRGELHDWERAALEDYRRRLDLAPELCRTVEAVFPVLVGAMAEKHWDFSRPRWLQRLYGLGA